MTNCIPKRPIKAGEVVSTEDVVILPDTDFSLITYTMWDNETRRAYDAAEVDAAIESLTSSIRGLVRELDEARRSRKSADDDAAHAARVKQARLQCELDQIRREQASDNVLRGRILDSVAATYGVARGLSYATAVDRPIVTAPGWPYT